MTRVEQLEQALLGTAAHGRAILHLASAGVLTKAVVDSSEELFATAAELAITPEAETSDCDHPVDRRIDFGTTNGIADWQCGRCGYRTVPPGG